MIMPGQASTKAVRAVLVVDPAGVIRTISYYPLSTGRNFELLRLIKALQTADAFGVATPAGWRLGDPGRSSSRPLGSCGAASDRMAGAEEGVECEDWFFCTKQISESDIEAAIRAK
jgi:peroxiredoxin (alkyl hydroperoxide reductase subunit C)